MKAHLGGRTKGLEKPALFRAGPDRDDHAERSRVDAVAQPLTEVLIELAVVIGRTRHRHGSEEAEADHDEGCLREPRPPRSISTP
ncbi:MAG: hypothetical protein DMF89_05265 [Acidobacteria bacterium]|nr:MAG: hypothetical protein DMF89_05265 [Acidobacteriota bacterium]